MTASAEQNTTQVGGDHYKKQKIQHWDYVVANNIPYLEAQVIKYCSRWRDKGGVQDLKKAQHFLAKCIAVEEDRLAGAAFTGKNRRVNIRDRRMVHHSPVSERRAQGGERRRVAPPRA